MHYKELLIPKLGTEATRPAYDETLDRQQANLDAYSHAIPALQREAAARIAALVSMRR